MAVGQQHNLEHHARVVGAGADLVVLELAILLREVEFVVHQVVQGKREAARHDLFGLHDWQQQAVSFLGFVAGHGFAGSLR